MSRIVNTRELGERDIDGVTVRVIEQTWADGGRSYEVWRGEVDLTVNESFDNDPTDEQIRALLDELDDTGSDLPAVVALSPTLRGLLAHAQAYADGVITPYGVEDIDPLDLLRDIVTEVRAGAVAGPAQRWRVIDADAANGPGNWERDGVLVGIVDEQRGGIVAYCHAETAPRLLVTLAGQDRVVAALALLDRLDESAENYSTDTIRAALTGDDPDRTGVRSYLDASTRHLPPEVCARLHVCIGLVVDRLHDGGWLLYVPEDPDGHAAAYTEFPDGVPESVLALQRHARERGCDRVLLDRDAATIAGLPTYEWA